MKKISVAYRFAIVISALWLLFVGAQASSRRSEVFFYGMIPLVLLWGGGWFLLGFDRIRKFFDRKKYIFIVVTCPNEECKKRLRFPTATGVNTKVRCPKCGTEFINIG